MIMREKWNDKWRDELERNFESIFDRLCECSNIRNDIKIIAQLMFEYNYENYTAKECLDRTLEWIGDWNGQHCVTDLSEDLYKAFTPKLKRDLSQPKVVNIIELCNELRNLKLCVLKVADAIDHIEYENDVNINDVYGFCDNYVFEDCFEEVPERIECWINDILDGNGEVDE